MGANSNLFLHLRDAEMNNEYNHIQESNYSQIDLQTLYRTFSGKVVLEKNINGRIKWCRYPESDKTYPFNKNQLELIYDKEEKIKLLKLFK